MLDEIKELLLDRFHFGEKSDCIKVDAPIGFTGEVKIWPVATAPAGFLLCDGSSLLRADYSALFSVIGTVFGTVDATHFTLPDLRGKVVAGALSTDTDFHEVGHAGGGKTHSHTTGGTSVSHTHNAVGATGQFMQINSGENAYSFIGSGAGGYYSRKTAGNNEDHTHTAGSGVADSTLQPHLTLNYIIKY